MALNVDIEKRLGSFHLRVRLEAADGVLALLGASGSGKTMTLRCIAGLETPDRGRIALDGAPLFDRARRVSLPPQKRGAGLLLQSGALFPNMTVRQNIAAGARRQPDRAALTDALLARFELEPTADLLPRQLSGGQQQRTALARLLAARPRMLLLDEPFSALDSHLRFRLERELRQVIRGFGGVVLLVTHDRDEAFRLADRVAVLHDGAVEAAGPTEALFANPRTRRAAVLTGCQNLSAVRPLGDGRVLAADWGVALTAALPAGTAFLGIRARDLTPAPGENSFLWDVAEELENPFSYTIFLTPAGGAAAAPLAWETDKETWRRLRGPQVRLSLPPAALLPLRDGPAERGEDR